MVSVDSACAWQWWFEGQGGSAMCDNVGAKTLLRAGDQDLRIVQRDFVRSHAGKLHVLSAGIGPGAECHRTLRTGLDLFRIFFGGSHTPC